jgi:hypothetical protein
MYLANGFREIRHDTLDASEDKLHAMIYYRLDLGIAI